MTHQDHKNTQSDLLVRLDDTNLMLDNPDDDIRGHKVMDSHDEAIGHVSNLFIDKEKRKIRFLQVSAGGFLGLGEREFLIPVEDVTRTTEDKVYISHSRDHVVKSPAFDPRLTTRPKNDFWYPYYGYYGYTPYYGGGRF